MRTFLWGLLVLGLVALAAWIVIGPWFPKSPFVILLISAFFVLPNIGTIWMLYVAVRYEEHTLPFALSAFLPYAFLWYYFERVRHGKHLTRLPAPESSTFGRG